MLYLSLVMDHIYVLCSNSLSNAEEPPSPVTLIRWSESSPISSYVDPRWEQGRGVRRGRGGGGRRRNWQVDVVDKCRRGGLTFTTFFLLKKAPGADWGSLSSVGTCKQLNALPPLVCCFAKLDDAWTGSVFSAWTFAMLSAVWSSKQKKKHVLCNCKALKVATFVMWGILWSWFNFCHELHFVAFC